MIQLKDITVEVYMALAKNKTLLELMGLNNPTMAEIRERILEDSQPPEIITDLDTRLCVYETPTTPAYGNISERGWVNIDIYVHKDNNRSREILVIAQELINSVDAKQRIKRGLSPVNAGIQLDYHSRLPNRATDNIDWSRYGLIFKYDLIRL